MTFTVNVEITGAKAGVEGESKDEVARRFHDQIENALRMLGWKRIRVFASEEVPR